MTPAEWTAFLDVKAKVEALEAHHAGRIHRDPHGLKLAREAVRALRSTVAVAAPGTARLGEAEPMEWVSIPQACRILSKPYDTLRRRAERGLADGTGRRVGRRLQLHLPSQPEAACG